MNMSELVGAGILLLIVAAFIVIVIRGILATRFQFRIKHFIQFIPLLMLTAAAVTAYYQPTETERYILYGILLAYFLVLIIIWYVKGALEERKHKKRIRRYLQ